MMKAEVTISPSLLPGLHIYIFEKVFYLLFKNENIHLCFLYFYGIFQSTEILNYKIQLLVEAWRA